MKLPKLIIPSFTQHIIIERLACVVYYVKFWGCRKKISQDTAPIFEESGGGFHVHLLI